MRALVASIVLTTLFAPAVAHAESPAVEARARAGEAGSDNPFLGSLITYRNSVSALTFDKGAELSYNPTWVMSLELAPRFRLDKVFYVAASLDFAREVTNDDSSTMRGETWLGNLDLRAGASRFATIPGVGIDLTATLDVIFPTSKAATAQTMLFGVAPGLRLSRHFDVLSGLDLGYTVRVSKYFHRYTTGETATPVIPGCFNSAAGCDSYLNDGVRNTSWRLTNAFDLSLAFTEWLSFDASVSILTGYLYGGISDPLVDFTPQAPTNTRHALVYEFGLTAAPLSYLSVGFGATTYNPQQKPDSSNYAPFINRYTALYLDLRLDVADLVATATR